MDTALEQSEEDVKSSMDGCGDNDFGTIYTTL